MQLRQRPYNRQTSTSFFLSFSFTSPSPRFWLFPLLKIVHFASPEKQAGGSPPPRGSLSSELLISSDRALYICERYNYPQEGEGVALNILARAPLLLSPFPTHNSSFSASSSVCLLSILSIVRFLRLVPRFRVSYVREYVRTEQLGWLYNLTLRSQQCPFNF